MIELKMHKLKKILRFVSLIVVVVFYAQSIACAAPNKDSNKSRESYIDEIEVIEASTNYMLRGENPTVINYGTPYKDNGYTIVRVLTKPKNNKREWDKIDWHGDGEPWALNPSSKNYRQFSRSEPKHFAIRPTLNGNGLRGNVYVDLWVMKATIYNKVLGDNPGQNGYRFHSFDPTGQELGAKIFYRNPNKSAFDPDTYDVAGKMVSIGTLLPSGVADVIKPKGLMYRRSLMARHFVSNVSQSEPVVWDWDDGYLGRPEKYNATARTVPVNGKIYASDAPNAWFGYGPTLLNGFQWDHRTVERHLNFIMSIWFNGDVISEEENQVRWFFEGKWQYSSNFIPWKGLHGNLGFVALPSNHGQLTGSTE